MNPRLSQHHGSTRNTCAAWKKQRRPSACCRRDGVSLRGAPRRRFQACWRCRKTKARCSQQRKELLTCGLLHRPCRELARSVRSVRKRAVCRLRQTLRLREGRGRPQDPVVRPTPSQVTGYILVPTRRRTTPTTFFRAAPTQGCHPCVSLIGRAVRYLTLSVTRPPPNAPPHESRDADRIPSSAGERTRVRARGRARAVALRW